MAKIPVLVLSETEKHEIRIANETFLLGNAISNEDLDKLINYYKSLDCLCQALENDCMLFKREVINRLHALEGFAMARKNYNHERKGSNDAN